MGETDGVRGYDAENHATVFVGQLPGRSTAVGDVEFLGRAVDERRDEGAGDNPGVRAHISPHRGANSPGKRPPIAWVEPTLTAALRCQAWEILPTIRSRVAGSCQITQA